MDSFSTPSGFVDILAATHLFPRPATLWPETEYLDADNSPDNSRAILSEGCAA